VWGPNSNKMVAIMYRRKEQTTANGGVNWWPRDTIESGIGFGSMIYHHGLTPEETIFKEGSNNERLRIGQKPIELIRKMMPLVSRPGDLVIDLFSGTGTIPLVAQMLMRHVAAVELEKDVALVARKRLNSYFLEGLADKLHGEVARRHNLIFEVGTHNPLAPII